VATDAQRTLAVRRAIAATTLNGLGRSARFGGFADSLLGTLGELESGLVEPTDLDGDLARLHTAYRHELERTELWARDLQRRGASRARPGARVPRTLAVRRARPRPARARGHVPLLRGSRRPRRARARRRGAPRADPGGNSRRPDRGRLPVARPLARSARDGAGDARRPVRGRGPGPP